MEYLIGIGLALAVFVFASLSGFDRERAFYSTVVIVVANFYVLFAVMGGNKQALIEESLIAVVFAAVAVAGFKISPWLTAAGLVGHGLLDSVHHLFIHNPGVPVWWPGFCLSYDILAGGLLAILLMRRSGLALTPAK
jgi:hypothetical protein